MQILHVVFTNACSKHPKLRAQAFRFYVIDRAALFPISFDQKPFLCVRVYNIL